jgi:hypothetical protein
MAKKTQKPMTIQDLYSDYSPEEQEEARIMWKNYVALVWRIYNRLKIEGKLEDVKKSLLRHEWEKRSRKK